MMEANIIQKKMIPQDAMKIKKGSKKQQKPKSKQMA